MPLSCYGANMLSAPKHVVLGYVTLLGSLSLLEAAPTSTTLDKQIQPCRRDDYTYTPGVGAHKIHTAWVTWNTGRRTCDGDGAYLAIINSVAEAEAIVRLLEQENLPRVFVGLHDLFNEEEFVTIHGESVGRTGFDKWQHGEPNNDANQNCVVLNADGKYDDVRCNSRIPFVCELRGIQSEVHQDSSDVVETVIAVHELLTTEATTV